MSLACPVCRADNSEPGNCRRCRADLSLLWSVAAERRRLLDVCRQAACAGDGEEVIRQAGRAHALRRGEDTHRYLALGHLLQEHYFDAFKWLCNVQA
jgi:hypothetical protein